VINDIITIIVIQEIVFNHNTIYSPSLKQIYIVEVIELDSYFLCDLCVSHTKDSS